MAAATITAADRAAARPQDGDDFAGSFAPPDAQSAKPLTVGAQAICQVAIVEPIAGHAQHGTAAADGRFDILRKPFELAALERAIAAALSGTKRRRRTA